MAEETPSDLTQVQVGGPTVPAFGRTPIPRDGTYHLMLLEADDQGGMMFTFRLAVRKE